MTVIRAQGPDVTMDDVAAAADVSKPILYRTIGDKDALVAALAEVVVDAMNDAVDRAVERSRGGRANFEAAMRGSLQAIDDDRNLFLFVTAGGPGTESFRSLVDRSAAQMIERFTAMRIRAGLDPAPARTWAYAIVGAIQVVAVMWLRDEFADLDDLAAQLTSLVWPGLTAADR